MKYVFIALSLALAFGPVAAQADDQSTPPQLTQQQRQQLRQTFEQFRQQEHQLHTQLRSQILNSISPAHRQTIAGIIGSLAISPNPNPQTAARQIDGLLSQTEQQRILSLHNSYRTQERNLHEQMRAQLQKELPAGMQRHWGQDHGMNSNHMQPPNLDAGTVLLKTLAHPDMPMMGPHPGMWPGGPGGR
ncbi:MAG TPA: hypothetical protein VMF61_08530 [Candidatus Acidoferrales bacterium]|nr:hypothetical protein [Candidatus Acidoferrales bacterium]